jgi:hypothetical protein
VLRAQGLYSLGHFITPKSNIRSLIIAEDAEAPRHYGFYDGYVQPSHANIDYLLDRVRQSNITQLDLSGNNFSRDNIVHVQASTHTHTNGAVDRTMARPVRSCWRATVRCWIFA